ncbi:MFS general substrate transporter [Gonapodya prolifera JEL478]|uniref:MFS general substrate transporter n=1 Tax=Gonapodya prolifera (strain JEL478) TaxID=1344416 RepID=A0A139AB89_GONPJ|nr:MFS general substrate transporter [Gonapodya prolifera JEL478]|eukprot:KXS13978.1 MFS general substrate transporter [Gonapodya prolifera JEL478]
MASKGETQVPFVESKDSEAGYVKKEWTDEEERKVMNKVNWKLIPWLMVCYMVVGIDRTNIGSAAIMNKETPGHSLEEELGMHGSDLNWATSAFFFGYVLFEIPSNMMITKTSPSVWISRIMTTWGIIAAVMGAVHNFAGLIAVRVLLGIMEAGFTPGAALYLTFWFKKYEVGSRVAYMFAGAGMMSAFSGFIAYGIAYMDGVGGLTGWRWLFILEGIASSILGIATYFVLPDYPQTSTFLNSDERAIVVGRLPPSAPSFVAKEMNWKEIAELLRDWRMYALASAQFLITVHNYGLAFFLPKVISAMGFVSTTALLIKVPIDFIGHAWNFYINWSSDRYQEKVYHSLVCALPVLVAWALLGTIQPYLSQYGRYGLLYLSIFYNGLPPMQIGIGATSTTGATKTAFRTGFIISMSNIGGIVGGQVYQPDDAPLYIRGHWINFGLMAANIIILQIVIWSLTREGIYMGKNANVTVVERGGIEVDGEHVVDFAQVAQAGKLAGKK